MSKSYKKSGVIGTIIYHALLLLFLIFFGMSTIPGDEEGVLVNLGNTLIAGGDAEPLKSNPQPQEESQTPPPAQQQPKTADEVKDNIKTQDYDEEAPVVKSAEEIAKEKAEREKQAEIDRQKKIEAEKRRQEEIERKRKEEEARKLKELQDKQSKEARNNISNAFGKSGTGTSEGDKTGAGNQGYVTGDPNSSNRTGSGLGDKGNSFSLAGRSLIGTLPKPDYSIQEEGIVVVKIRVDRNGNVTEASWQQKGSTTTNKTLRDAALIAAKKAKFNKNPDAAYAQEGTITYHFELD